MNIDQLCELAQELDDAKTRETQDAGEDCSVDAFLALFAEMHGDSHLRSAAKAAGLTDELEEVIGKVVLTEKEIAEATAANHATATDFPYTPAEMGIATDAAWHSHLTGAVKLVNWTEGVAAALHSIAEDVALPKSGGIEYRSSEGWRVRLVGGAA